ncbi:hypothetical protein ACFSTC_26595 [Nonomuraea ferruginea]
MPLTSPMSPAPVGRLRVLRPADETVVDKAVAVGLVVPQIGLDSHMIFVFTRPGSAVPHFTLDSVASAEYHAMHLDLIPRAELAVNLEYLDACFLPLTEPLDGAWQLDGLSPAAIGPPAAGHDVALDAGVPRHRGRLRQARRHRGRLPGPLARARRRRRARALR